MQDIVVSSTSTIALVTDVKWTQPAKMNKMDIRAYVLLDGQVQNINNDNNNNNNNNNNRATIISAIFVIIIG